ncbi:MAG: glycosyltransferase [Chthoniobacterales bacterium]|nr:glycosyltransferase [Chthoniobacterales bacterium]
MKIAFFGSSLVSAFWNGSATYYRGIIRYLHERGHRITFYEPDAYERQQHRDFPEPDWARVVVYPPTEEAAARLIEEASLGADVMVKTSGVGVLDEFLEKAIAETKRPDNLTIFWDVDAPATLERMEEDPDDLFRALVPRYDYILTYGGGQPVVDGYKAFGAKECIPIYNALDPETHYLAPPEARFAGTLGFLGNRLPDREARVHEFFLRAATLLPNEPFILGGSGWEQPHLPPNVHHVGHVYSRDHNAFNCSSRALLNVNRASMARYGFSPPTRVFEAAGAAACLITDAWVGIELFLEPNEEVFVARDGAEVAAIVEALTPERAREVGEAARRRILSEHTYRHRAEQFDQIMEGVMA